MLNASLLYKLMISNSTAYQDLIINNKFLELIEGLNQNSVVLDIGANIGNISNFIFEKKQPHIYAFEPNKFSRLGCQITVNDDLDGLVVKMPSKQA